MNREKELEAFRQWWAVFAYSPFNGLESDAMGAWLARAELSANDNQVIAELAETLRFIALEGYGRPSIMMVRAREQLAKHAERIKQAQETRGRE